VLPGGRELSSAHACVCAIGVRMCESVEVRHDVLSRMRLWFVRACAPGGAAGRSDRQGRPGFAARLAASHGSYEVSVGEIPYAAEYRNQKGKAAPVAPPPRSLAPPPLPALTWYGCVRRIACSVRERFLEKTATLKLQPCRQPRMPSGARPCRVGYHCRAGYTLQFGSSSSLSLSRTKWASRRRRQVASGNRRRSEAA
jgi:hypothetical protein